MNIPDALAADLALLDEALDGSVPGISTTLSRLVAHALRAVPSYVGLSLLVRGADLAPWEFTTVDRAPGAPRIATSLRVGLHETPADEGREPASIELLLFAARPGALVDLAAALAWLAGRPLSEVRVDEDLADPVASLETEAALTAWSAHHQALGVLVADGLTLEEAERELEARAAAAGRARSEAAAEILASLDGRPTE